jgi:hypothetical protein
MTRSVVFGIGAVVVAAVVVMIYLVWWPALLDALAAMHGQPPPIHGSR